MTCTRFFRSFCRAEEGAFTFLLIFFILGSMMALGVSVDYANAMRKGEQMQYTANAVALAAAQDLPVKENAIDAGLAIAALNLAQTNNIAAVGQSDIRVGNFDAATGMFTVDVQPFNAVDVRVVRDANRGNALVTYLARLAGRPSYDIDVRAVALATGGGAPCSSGGFFSNDRVYSGSNNDCTNGFCLYGRLGVKISSDNSFEEGVKVEMPRLRDFEQGGSNAGIDNALNENEYPNLADAYNSVPGIVASLQAGDLSVLPSHLNITEVKYREKIEESDLPLEENTLYIVDDVADFGSDQTIKNIAVVAVKEVKMGSNNWIQNVAFASMDKLLLGSNNIWAENDFCDTGKYDSFLWGGENIEYGSNNTGRGIEMKALGDIKLGSNVGAVLGVRGVARLAIEYGCNEAFAGCPNPLLDDEEVTFTTFALIR